MCFPLVVSQPEIHVRYQYNSNRTATLILHWLRHVSQLDQRYLIQYNQDSNTDLAEKHKNVHWLRHISQPDQRGIDTIKTRRQHLQQENDCLLACFQKHQHYSRQLWLIFVSALLSQFSNA